VDHGPHLAIGMNGHQFRAVGGGAAAALAWLANRQIGGYTGDVLGGVQQVTEIAILLAAAALA